MVTRVPPSEWRWLRALLVLGTFTVGLVLLGLIANVALYFSDILLILILSWLFAFILSPIVSRILRIFPTLPRLAVVVGVYAGSSSSWWRCCCCSPRSWRHRSAGSSPTSRRSPEPAAPSARSVAAVAHVTRLPGQPEGHGDAGNRKPQDLRGQLVGPLTGLAGATLGFVGNLFIVVFLSLFILIDKDRMVAFVNRLVPPRWSEEANLFEASVSSAFGGFLRGQAIQGLLYGAIAAPAAPVLGLEYMPVTTAAVAILQMVPFFGPFFSWAPPVLVALLTKPDATLPIFIVMAIGWFVVMNIVAPRVMASSVGIHPVVVLISVLIGLKLQGVVGAIFAIPVAAVISTFFFYYLNRTQTAPKDVTTRAVKRVEAREGRRVRVPAPPPVVPEAATSTGSVGGPLPGSVPASAAGGPAASRACDLRTVAPRRAATPAAPGAGGDGQRETTRRERRDLDRERGEPLAAGERRGPRPRATVRMARPLAEWPTRPRILVTNDDGIESRGLLALAQALRPIGDVYVVAPETNQSSVGHQKTLMRPLRVRERTLADGSNAWSVDGSPTDAVSLAFLGYFDIGFDLVASGINYGANLGDDVTYSGTVSAAMEAAINECPAFAISQEYYEHPDFTLAAAAAHLTAVNILENGLGPASC